MNKLKKLFITCGGTGGHFYPGLTVAKEFQDQGGEVLLLLSGVNAAKQSEIARDAGIESVILPRMPHPFQNPFKFISGAVGGTTRSTALFRGRKPDALLGMGSFASTPAILGAKLTGTPVFLHDGNARIGKANRVFSSAAKVLATGYPPVNASAARCRITETGMPVRQTLISKSGISKSEAISELNNKFTSALDCNLTTILVFGGSQGAAVFNKYFPEAFCNIANKDFQVLHLAGKGKLEQTSQLYREAKFPYLVLESSEDMHLFLAAADVAVCRSGGSSLAELALFGLPAVLIPYPYAAEGHQTDNAGVFVRRNAALMVNNAELTAAKAEEITSLLLQSQDDLRKMAKNMRSLAKPDAARDLLTTIDKSLN